MHTIKNLDALRKKNSAWMQILQAIIVVIELEIGLFSDLEHFDPIPMGDGS